MAFYDKFPYTNFQELNLDYVLRALSLMQSELKNFISNNVIKYADPIQWDITKQYGPNTVVADSDGNAFLSSKPVPVGISLNNTEYWSQIGNFDALFQIIQKAITPYNAPILGVASEYNLIPGDLIWINNELYTATRNIAVGDTLAAGTNVELSDINERIKKLTNDITQFETDINAEFDAFEGTVNQQLQQFEQELNNVTFENDRAQSAVADIGHYPTDGTQQGGFTFGNYFYSYQAGSDDITGKFIVINLTDGTTSEINGCAFGHGNDFTVVNGYVYCAPYSYANVFTMSVLRAPLSNLSAVETFYTFNNLGSVNRVYGITNNEGVLICALRSNDFGVSDTIFRTLDINSMTDSALPALWGNFKFKNSEFPHPIDFYENRLYLTVSTAGMGESIATFHLKEGTIVLESKTYLPLHSPCGMEITEIEAIGRTNVFGLNYLIIICLSYLGNHIFAYDCAGRAPVTMFTPINISSFTAGTVYVNESSASVFEDGSTTYPVKSLQRAQYYKALCPDKALVLQTIGNVTDAALNITVSHIFLNLGGDLYRLFTTGGARSITVRPVNYSVRNKIGSVNVSNNSDLFIDANEITGTITVNSGKLRTMDTKINGNIDLPWPGGELYLSKTYDSPAVTLTAGGNSLIQVNMTSGITFSVGGGVTILTPGTK